MISICIPTYTRASMLAELLDSIFAESPDPNLVEVVVSDDASTDNTLEMLAGYCEKYSILRVISQKKNIGFDRNFLTVVAAAKGDYVWILGDDDRLEKGSLENVLNAIKLYPDVAGITLGSIDYDSELVAPTGYKVLPDTKLMHSAEEVFSQIGHLLGFMSTLVVHRQSWLEVCDSEPVERFFKLYVQVYIIGKMLQRKPLWLVYNKNCVGYRSDNDQFIKKLGWYERLVADVEGYHAIAAALFEEKKSSKLFEQKIFNSHIKARLINGVSNNSVNGTKLKTIQLLYKFYGWHTKYWLLALPILIFPSTFISSVRSFYKNYIWFSGSRRAKRLEK